MPIDPSIAANTGMRPPTPIDFGAMAQQRAAIRNAMLQAQIRANEIQDYNRFQQEVTADGFNPRDPETIQRLAALPQGRDFLTGINTGQTYSNAAATGERAASDFTNTQTRETLGTDPANVDPDHLQQALDRVLSIPGVNQELARDTFGRLSAEPDPMRRLALMRNFVMQDPQARAQLEATLPRPQQINQGDRIVIWDSNPNSAGYGHEITSYDVQIPPGQQISLGQAASRQDFEEGVGRPPGFNPVGPAPRNVAPTPRPGGRRAPAAGHATLPPGFRPVPGT